ncbi:hypothetical protein NNC19_17685 [Clostridium sp. SHJSY1]|uniref:hypothetical protein n=1 Tax=Clostridium sp. SHJSY1 TaxID=2942483 RepID=UPI002874387B|nr:hypothetical protein [Clostridium sp. SHJSY1]MDS0527525.1 hypothetical protein [Clostridium sp. SHJSY1]
MNRKRIFTLLISLTLALNIAGCGKSETESTSSSETTTEEGSSASAEENFTKIENTENTIFELGSKQTKEIKEILEKYSVKTAYNADKNMKAQVRIAKDENDCSIKGAKGYNISTTGTLKVNDGGDHGYEVIYNAYQTENSTEPRYLYRITIEYPAAEEFKLDNFNMFKELVQEVHGDSYDFASLESWIKEQLTKKQAGEKLGGTTRDMGSYSEALEGGDKKAGTEVYSLTYAVSLRK